MLFTTIPFSHLFHSPFPSSLVSFSAAYARAAQTRPHPVLKTVTDFRNHVAALGLDLPCEDSIIRGFDSPLARPWTASPSMAKR